MHSNRRRSNGSWQWKGAGLKKLSRGKGLQVCLLGDHLGNIPSKLFPVIKVQGSLTIHRTRWHFRHRFEVDVKVWSNGVNNMWLTFWLRLLYLGYFAITNEAFGSCMQLLCKWKVMWWLPIGAMDKRDVFPLQWGQQFCGQYRQDISCSWADLSTNGWFCVP